MAAFYILSVILHLKQRERAEGEELESDESDWEPEAEVMPPEREQTRSGRQRKRPSFFQEFESQENNLDSILAEFEQTQVIRHFKLGIVITNLIS